MAVDTESLLIRLEATSEQLRREMRRAEQSVGNGSKKMERELRRVDQGMEKLNKTAALVRRGLGALGVGLSIQGLRNVATAALTTADALANTADRVGLSTQALQQFRFAANQVGVSSNTLDMAMQRLTRRFGEAAQGKGELVGVLEEFKIATHDANDQVRASEDVMLDLADAIASVESPAERLRIAFKAFDSEGAALVNIMRDGSDGLRRYMREAQEFGMVLSDDLLQAARDVNTQLGNLNQTVRTQIQEGFLRTFTGQFSDLSDIAKDPDFHQGLQGIGRFIGAIGIAAGEAVAEVGRLIQIFRDPSWSTLAEFFTEGTVIGLTRRTLQGFGLTGPNSPEDALTRLRDLTVELKEARDALMEDPGRPGLIEQVAQLEQERNKLLGMFDPVAGVAEDVAITLDTISVTASDIEDTTSSTASNVAEISEHEKAILAALEAATAAREQHAEDVARTLQDLEREAELGEIQLQYLGDQTGELEVQQRLYEIRNRLGERAARQAEPYLRQLQRQTQEIRAQAEAQRRFNQVVDDTVRYGSDLFADLFRETGSGWRDMWENMRQTMISALARMAAEAALRPIVVSVLGAIGVAGAGAAAGAAGMVPGGGGLFGLSNLSDLSSIFNASGGSMMPGVDAWAQANLGFGSIGEMARPTAGFIGPMPAQTAGLLNGGSAMAGFASLGNVLGIAGSALPGLMSGNYAQAGFGAAGAAIGTALLPGIGTAIGGFLGNAVGSLFGGGNKDQEIRPISYAPSSGRGRQTPLRGIELDTLRYKGGGAFKDAVQQADEAIAQYLSDRMVEQVRDFLDERGTIRGKRRDNKAIGEKHIRRALREMYSPVIQALGGTEASRAFSSMTSSAKPEEVLETAVKIAAFLGQLNDETLFKPQEISQIEQAWSALHQQFDEVRAMAEKLGQSMALVEKQIGQAEQAFRDDFNDSIQRAISDLTGGTMAMEQAFRDLQKQQEQRLKDAELIGADIVEVERLNLLERLALLEQFGLASGDFATETERAAFGVARYGQGMAQFAVNLGQAAQRAAGQYRSLITSLQDSLDDLLIGPLSNLNFFEQQRIAEQKFNELAAAAMQGSTEAMGQLPQAGRQFLELTAQLYGNAGKSYDAAIKHVIAVQEEAQQAAMHHADEQQQIADHAAQMAQVYQEAMQAVAMAISDGVILPEEVREIEQRFGAVTKASQRMGPAGELFAMELANVAKMLEDGLLTDNEIAALMDNVALFNATLVDGLLTSGEIAAIRVRQDLINDVIRRGTISDDALQVLQAQARAVAATIEYAVTDEALETLRDHARTAASILRHDTIPQAVIDHLVTQADLIAGTIRGGVFDAETRNVLADRLADLRALWRDGAPKPNDIKAIRAQVDLARAALVDGVVTSKEVKAIKDQVAMVRNAYKDGVITNSEIKLIQKGTNKLIKEIERIPNAVDHIAARVGDSLALLRGVADQHAAQQRQQAIGQYRTGVMGNVSDILGGAPSQPTQSQMGRSDQKWRELEDYAGASLNLASGTMSDWTTYNDRGRDYYKPWAQEYGRVMSQLAQQLHDLVGGELPGMTISAMRKNGVPRLSFSFDGGGTRTFSGENIDANEVFRSFMRSLSYNMLDSVDESLRWVLDEAWKGGRSVREGFDWLLGALERRDAIPGFASGGIHMGGLAMVGERGPELVNFSTPARIYSAPDTNRILASNDNSEVVKELRTLVQQQGRMIEVISAQAAADRADNAALREELAALKRETRQQGRRPGHGKAA